MNPIEQLKSVLCDPEGKCCIAGADEDRAIIDRALQALAEPVVEPVAYRSLLASGNYTYCDTDVFLDNAEPLYTAPPPPAEVPLLTDDEIEKLRKEAFSTTNPFCPVDSKSMRKAARTIEQAVRQKASGRCVGQSNISET